MTLIINGKTYEASELVAYIEKLEKENAKLKRCEICKEFQGSCNYQYYSQQVCKENGMKLFKLKEIKEK